MVNDDVDDAVAEVTWVAEVGLKGGVLVPGVAPDSGLPPLYSSVYDPIWALCAELGVVVNHHGGQAAPQYDDDPVAGMLALVENKMWCHRTLWHLVFAGVFERYRDLTFVMTEQRTGWMPTAMKHHDSMCDRARLRVPEFQLTDLDRYFEDPAAPSERVRGREHLSRLEHPPPREVELRHEVGVERIMWGLDYPHSEGPYPYVLESLQVALAGVPRNEVEMMLSRTAAKVYGFDLGALDRQAARLGPLVSEVHEPPLECPAPAVCQIFDPNWYVEYR